jgi:hypothetical protein
MFTVVISRTLVFAALFLGSFSLAAILWLEMRREQRRRRLARGVECLLRERSRRRGAYEGKRLKPAA